MQTAPRFVRADGRLEKQFGRVTTETATRAGASVLRPVHRARREFLVANIRATILAETIERHARGGTNESGAQPEASEDVPRHIRDVIGEALAGRSLELANLESCAAFAAREPLIKAQLGGDLHEALLALRAMQGDGVVGHSKSLSARF